MYVQLRARSNLILCAESKSVSRDQGLRADKLSTETLCGMRDNMHICLHV